MRRGLGRLRRMRRATCWARVAFILATIAKVIATPWGAAVTTLTALAAAAGLWLADWQHVQYWLASLATFVGIIWAAAGIVWLGTRSEPHVVTSYRDYAYGLTFEGLIPHYHPDRADEALGFGIQLRNFSVGPIRYVVEEFDVRIGNRALPKVKKGHLTSIMSRGAGRLSNTVAFSKEDIAGLVGKNAKGVVDIAIDYGHPEEPPIRRLNVGLDVTLDFSNPPSLTFAAGIRSESDKAI